MSYDPQRSNPYAAAWQGVAQPQTGPVGPAAPQAQVGAGQQGAEGMDVQPPAVTPRVDVIESAEELVVRLDAPGFEKDQIEIHADANNLYVTADRSSEPAADTERGERALLNERPLRLERTIPMPAHIDPEQATAEHENGVCIIRVQKDEDDRRHEIGFQ
jgi:HSP20 family protein